ncbi:ATP binding microtubule motor family protein [Striga asiatica]|uniref:ATP binding microtubule motor family protein n=1 Tax=Striga asiatica TaxID=4170 RepID=A0A5A7PZM6_STRAF|nr:ATP binding microtubule motor family protein [Striga asiatica]
MTRLEEEAPANSVPAAAVRRGGQVFFGMTGRKGHVGVKSSFGPTLAGDDDVELTAEKDSAFRRSARWCGIDWVAWESFSEVKEPVKKEKSSCSSIGKKDKPGTTVRRENTRSHSDLDMWNRLAPYVLRLFGRHGQSPVQKCKWKWNEGIYFQLSYRGLSRPKYSGFSCEINFSSAKGEGQRKSLSLLLRNGVPSLIGEKNYFLQSIIWSRVKGYTRSSGPPLVLEVNHLLLKGSQRSLASNKRLSFQIPN